MRFPEYPFPLAVTLQAHRQAFRHVFKDLSLTQDEKIASILEMVKS
ncbi:MAG: hypothetical protein MZV70_33340 [Desulfobacterales bacterium]|nr:hypothetical protein [Desulfobacterales bacterium]